MAYRILVTESQSPLGEALCKALDNFTYTAINASVSRIDWGNAERIHALLQESRPDIVINTLMWAGNGESELPDLRKAMNAFEEAGAAVIHLSSHEVFPTSFQKQAMPENAQPFPDTPRGSQYLAAEMAALRLQHSIVLRLPWLVDWPGGILDTVCDGLILGEGFTASDAWYGSPSQISDVVRVVVAMVHQVLCGAENWGIFHLHTNDFCSEAEFVDLVKRILQKELKRPVADYTVVPVEKRFIATNGWLAGSRCTDCFGIQLRSWRQGIKTRVINWLKLATQSGKLPVEPEQIAAPYSG